VDAGVFVVEEESTQVTAEIAVGCWMVKLAVAVKVDCTWDVAAMVTTLLVGTVEGAVNMPPVLIDPVPVPLTDQFTSVLLRFKTVAVHCEVPNTVTEVGVHVTVIVGVVVVVVLLLLPQELIQAGMAMSARKKRRPSQRNP